MNGEQLMYRNSIVIQIEDLHANTMRVIGQHNFPNWKAAEAYALKLNEHYSDNCIPMIARVID
jgi:hypothetical protein